MTRIVWLTLALSIFASGHAAAETFNVGPDDDLFGILRNLNAGDEVVVAAGTYPTPGFLEVTWTGTREAVIVVRAADGARPVLLGDPSQNVININGSYFSLRGFEITGGSHGVRLGDVDHATFEDLVIHDVEDVALSCNRPDHACDSLTVMRNEIYNTGRSGTGEGMYIGCNNNDCAVTNSIFAENYLHDLAGSQADGIEIKTGSHGNIVRDNVIIGANYPAITMYGFPDGAGAPNVVERNLVWGTVDNGIQVVGQVIVRNNIVVNAGANGIHSKPSQGFSAHDVVIVHNTVYAAGGACLKTNDWSGQSGQIIANNALYCDGALAVDINGGAPEAIFSGNLALGEIRAPGGVELGADENVDLGNPGAMVLYPPAGSRLLDSGDSNHSASVDFNGVARTDGRPDVGAYERTADENPGWPLEQDFKDVLSGPPGDDAGPGGQPDAGPSGTDAGTGADGDGGCDCRLGGRSSPAGYGLIALLCGLLCFRRAVDAMDTTRSRT